MQLSIQITEALPSILIGVAIVIIIVGVKFVPQGMGYNVKRFGRYVRTLKSGIRFAFPVIEVISDKVNMREQVVKILPQEVTTRDKAIFDAEGVISFQVIDAGKTTYRVNHMYQIIVINIRGVIGATDLYKLLSKPDEINARVFTLVNDTASLLGIKINYIKIKCINPPRNAINDNKIINKPVSKKDLEHKPTLINKRARIEDLEPIRSQLIRDVRIYMAKEDFALDIFGRSTLYPMLQPYLDEAVEHRMRFVQMGGRPSGGSKKLKADILDNLTKLENI